MGIKAVGGAVKTVLQQGLKKTGANLFRREIAVVAEEGATKALKGCSKGINCFPAGTQVLMANGELRSIEKVRAGEFVLADDPLDGKPAKAQMVERVVENWTQRLYDIQTDRDGDALADATFRSTGEHPFWTSEHGWTAAKDLHLWDHLLGPDLSTVTVVSSSSRLAKVRTWNLTVAGAHDFYVVDHGSAVLVHNTNIGPKQWILYVAPLLSDPSRHYVGIGSMPAAARGIVSPEQVLEYRAGRNGTAHRKSKSGHIDGSKIETRGAGGRKDKWTESGSPVESKTLLMTT